MTQPDLAILRRFEQPDEIRQFELGKFEIVHIGGSAARPIFPVGNGRRMSAPSLVNPIARWNISVMS
jgi:hypothetical protein